MKRIAALAMIVAGLGGAAAAQPLGTAFTYQGRLTDAGNPAGGAYDFQFVLMDAAVGGAQVGPILTRDDVQVTNGLFVVSLDFGAVFTGNKRWLELGVRPGASTGAYSSLPPRQELAPAPNAVFSASAPWTGVTGKPAGFADDIDNDSGGDITGVAAGTGLSGGGTTGAVTLTVDPVTTQSRVTGTCPAGQAIRTINQAGTVVCEADDDALAWRTSGNAGTTPGTSFLGTTDTVALDLGVSGTRGWRLEPAAFGEHNIIGGSPLNLVDPGVFGATIAGGGQTLVEGRNRVTSFYGTVGGGAGNTSGNGAAVGGGFLNIADGSASTVPGGSENVAGGWYSLAAGQRAKVRTAAQSADGDGDEGTFVWADAAGADFVSTGPNQFLVRAANGVGINTNAPIGQLQLGAGSDPTAFRFGNAGARHHLISNRDTVFNGFDTDGLLNGSLLFLWRRNLTKFDENSSADLMRLTDNGNLVVFGNAAVLGTLSKGAGSFRIDHPLDPRNKYLYHSFVESPDMMNVYNGNVTTDGEGYAIVELPEWFEALNRDFRYQLTVIDEGDGFVLAKVARQVKDNRFTIRTSVPGTMVSWQVTGIRQDAFANQNRIPVEEEKTGDERGAYLHPEAFAGSREP